MLTQAAACSRCVTISVERGPQIGIKRAVQALGSAQQICPLHTLLGHRVFSSAMSASTTATHHEASCFPGNCTLDAALRTIIDVYHQYSGRGGKLDFLNFNEFQTLLKEQASGYLAACDRNRRGYLRHLFEETDLNGDRDLSFEEFTIVLAKLADDAHRISHGQDRCKPDRD
ncbi:protein S100-A7-like [Porphyrio hochstetteri]